MEDTKGSDGKAVVFSLDEMASKWLRYSAQNAILSDSVPKVAFSVSQFIFFSLFLFCITLWQKKNTLHCVESPLTRF